MIFSVHSMLMSIFKSLGVWMSLTRLFLQGCNLLRNLQSIFSALVWILNVIINVIQVDFKSYHKNNLSQGYTFFEDTFDQDLIWFGERICRYLCAKYTSNMHWLLVGDCNYSKMVQEGVRRCGLNFVASVHEIENHEDFNVLVASPKVPVTRQIVGDIAENFGCKRENVVCVAEDLYLALWD